MKKTLLLLLMGMFAMITAHAQIQVEIVVKTVYCDYTRDGGDDYGGRFRFYKNDPQDVCGKLMHPMCNNADERCIKLPWQKYYYNDAYWKPLSIVTLPAGTNTFTLFMKTHHERQKDCTFGSDSE